MTTASATCRKCSHVSGLLFTTRDYNCKLTHKWFEYFRCEACGYIFLDPVPADLGRYYPSQYYDIPVSDQDLTARARSSQQSKIDVVTQFVRGGTLLEIGAAYGLFSFLAKTAGFAVTAIEMDQRCCRFLRDTVGIEVVEGPNTIELLDKLPSFDVIVLWQVVEHLVDPWAVLSTAAAHLAPGGVLIVDTPNPSAFQFKVLGSRWTHVDAPRHLELIPADLLVSFAKSKGLVTESLVANGIISRRYNGFGWAHSLRSMATSPILASAAYLLGRVIAKLVAPIERTGWRGSTYTAVFRQPCQS